jgi:class 3 adenylate cyclase
VSRPLGRLATTLGRYDEAAAHFEDALASHEREGAPLWLANTRYEYAAMLQRRGAAGDGERAAVLLAEALDAAERFGMKALLEKGLALKLETEGLGGADFHGSIDALTTSLEAKPPDLAAQAAPDGTVTLMFSDMENFTAMTERLGDAAAYKVMATHNGIIRERTKAHGGFEVELLGDGFLMAFGSASRAAQCAVEIQHALRRYCEETPEEPIRVRMGLHTGEPIREGDKFFGKTVILAARIAAQAKAGEILVSSLLQQLLEAGRGFAFGPPRELALKGLAGMHRVFAVDWDGSLATAALAEPSKSESSDPINPIAPINPIFRHEGEFWTIQYDGRFMRLRDSKGLQYIRELLRRPGEEVHVVKLLGAEGGERSCKSSDAIERMRKAVGARVRDTTSRIREEIPGLGLHFENALRLGVFCSYTPDKPVRWTM